MNSVVSELEDRLSSLPDSIICDHILSLIPTKYAFRTSVLSTKWKYLHLHVPTIFLDQTSDEYKNPNFINFVSDRLMSCETSSIAEFRLHCLRLPANVPEINDWIHTLICLCNIKVLEIIEKLPVEPVSTLYPPSKLFRLKNLEVLKLCSRSIVLNFPETADLTTLYLIATKEQLFTLLHHTPNLEVLVWGLQEGFGHILSEDSLPACFAQTLKQVRLTGYIGDQDHVEAVRFFLMHGGAMEKMVLDDPFARTYTEELRPCPVELINS